MTGTVPALGCDDFLLDPGQKLLALCVRQTQICEIAEITRMVDHHQVDAAWPTFDPGFHQVQNPLYP